MDKVRLLLADDHEVVRAGIRKTVEELPDIEVTAEVGNGIELFAALERQVFDFLLVDVTMPEFEPISAVREIRARYPRLKILMISAYDDIVYVQGLLGAGVNGYLLKDQSLNDLKLAIQRVLSGERWISSPLIGKLVDSSSSQSEPSLPLTARQRTLLQLLLEGLDNQSIAQKMNLSVKTIENHLTRLYRHLGVQSRLEAVNYAIHHPNVMGLTGQEATNLSGVVIGENDGGISVMVVDDNNRYRYQLQRMLGKLCPRSTIYEAGDIQEAVNLAQKIKPRLALIDVVLSDEDGISCARRVKALSPQSQIILISAYPDREFHRLGLQAGAVAFLDKKDLDMHTLRQVVDDVIG